MPSGHVILRVGWRRLQAIVLSLIVVACGGPTLTPAPDVVTPSASTAAQPATDAPPCAEPSPPSPAADPWWRDRIFYEVFVRSFADSNGDGIGDLRGLAERLDYLNDGDPATAGDLGVTGIWLMPVAESPSYHGYDVVDYGSIERDYGTREDFEALLAAAHDRGIAVIVDLVLNHTSIDHPWFQDARTRGSAHEDWYLWADTQPAVAGPGGRPVWHPLDGRWYYGYFWEGMPDLNVGHPEVTVAIDDIARFWLDDLDVDGFRLDAARHLIEAGDQLENAPATFDWLAGFRQRTHAVAADALVLGEVWDSTDTAASYVQRGSLDMAFEFELAGAILGAIRLGDAETLAHVQARVLEAYPSGGYAAFLSNHDQDRVFDALGRDPAAARLAATLLLTNPGVPFIYYGEEVGLRGRKPDEEIRTPLPWEPAGPGFGFTTGTPWEPLAPGAETAAIVVQDGDPASLLNHYRALGALRAAHPALVTGRFQPVDATNRAIHANLRAGPDEILLVVANLADEPVDDVVLTLESGPLCGTPVAEALLGPTDVLAPIVTPAGGFVDYRPVARLEARESLIVRLSP